MPDASQPYRPTNDKILFLEQQKLDALVSAGANIDELIYDVQKQLDSMKGELEKLPLDEYSGRTALENTIATYQFKIGYLEGLKNRKNLMGS